jgi:capsular polysaccharide biosynthesis protein
VAHPKIQGVVVSTRTPKWAVEVLESLDLEIVFVSEQTIKIENYVCCSVPQISSKSDVNLMRESFSRYLTSEPKNLAFVGRGNRKRSLGLLEDDVARMIENHGGLLVDPEKLGWKHELEFFSGVDRFILTGGSASANVVWMRPGTKILALFPFGGFTTQIEKSQYEAAEVQYMEFNTDSLTRIDNLLEKRLLEFING